MAASAHNISMETAAFRDVGGFRDTLEMNEHRELALRLEVKHGLSVNLLEDCRSYHLCHSNTWRDPLVNLHSWESILLESSSRNDVRLLAFFWLTLGDSHRLPSHLKIATLEELIERADGDISEFEDFRRLSPLFGGGAHA
jgi:hypothetical protein